MPGALRKRRHVPAQPAAAWHACACPPPCPRPPPARLLPALTRLLHGWEPLSSPPSPPPLTLSAPPSGLQLDFIRAELAGHWGNRLMTKVQAIMHNVPAGSSADECAFPRLPGSHLTEVSGRLALGRWVGAGPVAPGAVLPCPLRLFPAARPAAHCPACPCSLLLGFWGSGLPLVDPTPVVDPTLVGPLLYLSACRTSWDRRPWRLCER